jgi:hypothetical protein
LNFKHCGGGGGGGGGGGSGGGGGMIVNILMLYFLLTFSRTKSTVDLRVPTKQIRDFPIFSVSNVSRLSPSSNRATDANSICRYLDAFSKHAVSHEDTFSFL